MGLGSTTLRVLRTITTQSHLRSVFRAPHSTSTFVAYRSEGIANKSKDWINRASQALWESTRGEMSHETMTALRIFVLGKYSSVDAHRKVLGFASAFHAARRKAFKEVLVSLAGVPVSLQKPHYVAPPCEAILRCSTVYARISLRSSSDSLF
jgi:hypothetical protein